MVIDIADVQTAKDRELIFGEIIIRTIIRTNVDDYFWKETIIRTTLQPISEYYCLRMERVRVNWESKQGLQRDGSLLPQV